MSFPSRRPTQWTRFLPLIWAWCWHRPTRTVLGLVSVAAAFALYGLALGMTESFYREAAEKRIAIGPEILWGAMGISAIGMFLILFLTACATVQSVRLRLAEFGVLKALGYEHSLILALVAAQSMLTWMAGAAAGLLAAKLLYVPIIALVPSLRVIPSLAYTPPMLAAAAALALVIGLFSTLPAARILRVEAIDALTGGLRVSRERREKKAAVSSFTSMALTASDPILPRSEKLDTHLLRQILAANRIGLSTIPHRLQGARTAVIAVGVVAFILAWGLSTRDSIRLMLLTSGDPARIMLVQPKPPWERSKLPPQLAAIAATGPEVARARNGTPLVEGLYRSNTKLIKRNNGQEGSVNILGVGPYWRETVPEFRLLAGRMPRPGARELIAGDIAREKFSGLDDDQVDFLDTRWRVVGTFAASPWLSAFLLGDAATLKAAAKQPHDNFVVVRLNRPDALDAFRQDVAPKLPPDIIIQRETDYYAGIWKSITETAQAMSLIYVVAGLAAFGATAAMTHVLRVVAEERAREIAVLRALGFGGIPVACSLVAEAILLSLAGVATGAAVEWLCFDGILYNGAYNVFRTTMTMHVVTVAMSWGLVIALAGVLPTAIRTARQTPIEALREV